MNEHPVLSIVMVTHNASSAATRTLDSIREQSGVGKAEFELIAVDAVSSDDTVNVIDRSGLATVVVSEPDAGIYDAMNKGAKLARGTWVQFLNAGDSFHGADALRRLIDGLMSAQESNAWAVCGAINGGGSSGATRVIRNIPHNWSRHALGLQPHCHQATFVRRSVFATGFEHSLSYGTAGDFDLILRLGVVSPPLEINSPCVWYEGGGVSQGRWRQTGKFQHASRVDRLQLYGLGARADAVIGDLVVCYLRCRVELGRLRHFLVRAPHNHTSAHRN